MPTELDLKVPAKVLAVVNRFGISTTFQPNDGAYNTADLSVGAPTSAVTTKATPPVEVHVDRVNNDQRLEYGDTMMVLAAQGLAWTPVPGMTTTIGGKSWVVKVVDTIRSGESIAAYVLYLRR